MPHPLRREPDELTPKSSWPWVKALLHSVYDQPDADALNAQFDRVLDGLWEKLPAVAEHREAARCDILAFTAFPQREQQTPKRANLSTKPTVPTPGNSREQHPSAQLFPRPPPYGRA